MSENDWENINYDSAEVKNEENSDNSYLMFKKKDFLSMKPLINIDDSAIYDLDVDFACMILETFGKRIPVPPFVNDRHSFSIDKRLWKFINKNRFWRGYQRQICVENVDLALFLLEGTENKIKFDPCYSEKLWDYCVVDMDYRCDEKDVDIYVKFLEYSKGKIYYKTGLNKKLWKFVTHTKGCVNSENLLNSVEFAEYYLQASGRKITEFFPDLHRDLWKFSDVESVLLKVHVSKKGVFNQNNKDYQQALVYVDQYLEKLYKDHSVLPYVKYLFTEFFKKKKEEKKEREKAEEMMKRFK